MGQGQSLATPLDPLVQRQSSCRATSDGKPGQEHPRSGQDDLEHSTEKDQRRLLATAKGLSPPTVASCLHSQEKRQKTPFGYSRHEMQSHAGTVLARSRPGGGNNSRRKLLR